MESKHLQMIAHGLILVAIMLGLIAAALWFKTDSIESKAHAETPSAYGAPTADRSGIPDAGRQRMMTVEQLDTVNKHLADIERGFRDGTFVIQTIAAKGGAPQDEKREARE